MNECIFCRIARNELPAEKILESERIVAFLDIRPRSPGHSLVIPKVHAEVLSQLDDEAAADVFAATRDVVKMLEKALSPDAFTIGINDGEAAGQEIPHLHVNIMPRFSGDGGRAIHSVVHNPPNEDISHTAQRIRSVV